MEILTTLTFDTLFKRIPSGVQAKAAKKNRPIQGEPFSFFPDNRKTSSEKTYN
jgi:hypothetical protein